MKENKEVTQSETKDEKTKVEETKENDVKTMFEQLNGWDEDDDYLGDSPYPRWG